jgi:glycosyltransferase involved in cell wall biosynthesis
MKVLYIFAGSRKKLRIETAGREYPDTQLYGLNHLAAEGIDADYKEPQELLPKSISRLIGFRLRHFLMFFATAGYDVVFGSALLYMLILKRFIPTKRKFIILNISLVRLLESNKHHGIKHNFLCWLLARADGIVNLSLFQQEYLSHVVPALQSRMRVIPLGVDVSFYNPNRPRGSFLLAAGRDNGRDYATVIEVARQLPERQFVIVCNKRNLVGVGTIPQNVTVHYDIPQQRMQRLLEEAFALLLIVRGDSYMDGADCSGQTVLLEAMASGCPVIATRKEYLVSGEYAVEGKEIILVPSTGVQEICSSIRALEDPKVRLTLGRAARKRAEKLSTEQMGKELSGFFTYVYQQ